MGKGLEQTHGQQVYGKMLNIINYQGKLQDATSHIRYGEITIPLYC
jgi:hypothetical protein